jgi:hypothetical protein
VSLTRVASISPAPFCLVPTLRRHVPQFGLHRVDAVVAHTAPFLLLRQKLPHGRGTQAVYAPEKNTPDMKGGCTSDHRRGIHPFQYELRLPSLFQLGNGS